MLDSVAAESRYRSCLKTFHHGEKRMKVLTVIAPINAQQQIANLLHIINPISGFTFSYPEGLRIETETETETEKGGQL